MKTNWCWRPGLNHVLGWWTAGVVALSLSACGGGGSNSGGTGGAPSIAGLGVGATLLGDSVVTAMLETGEMYAFILNGTQINRVDHGKLLVGDGMLNGTLTDYTVTTAGTLSGIIISGIYSPNSSTIAGGYSLQIAYTNATTFTTYSSTDLIQAPYSSPAQLQALSGSYSAPYLYNGSTISMTIDAAGNLTGSGPQCAITGTFTPHGSTLDLYDLKLSQSGSSCLPAGLTSASGIGFLYTETGASKPSLYLGALNSTQSSGFFWKGMQQ